jgi:hypothetical protein
VLGRYFYPSELVLPWSQLTSINAETITPAVAADILQEATVLVNLRCSLWDIDDVPRPVAPLTHLESLIIGVGENSFDKSQKFLLDALPTPALRHLSVSQRRLGDQPISTITSLLSRSHCSLDPPHITHSSLCEADYHAVLPTIKVIDVSALDTDDLRDENEEDEEDEGSDDSDD